MRRFLSLPKAAYFALGLVMVAAVWGLDKLAAGQVSMSIFYLLPISFVAWFCGGAWAYALPLSERGPLVLTETDPPLGVGARQR